jgi:hemolysin III
MRGWSHALAACAAIAMTVILWHLAEGDRPKQISLFVFGLSMIELYTHSAIYHIGRWPTVTRAVLRSIDHANIFVLIAGTYTPLCFNVLEGWQRITMLVVIWSLAAIGLIVAIFTARLPRWISPLLYVLMGWVALLVMPTLIHAINWGVLLLVGGGVLYTIGALVYARKWPDPFPRVFGFHEIFHLFVIAGSATFVVVVSVWVIPFARIH